MDEAPGGSSGPLKPVFWKSARRVAFRWLLILGGLYLFLLIFMYLFQSKLIYYPQGQLSGDPGDAGMAFENVTLTAGDGTELHAWWVPASGASRGAVLFCHGNAGNISQRIDSLRIFRNLNLDTLIFDYRGYGKSEGAPTEEGTYLDAEAAWKHLTHERGVPPGRVIIFGRSLGGAVAAHLAAKLARRGGRKPRALILESPFSSIPDMGAGMYPFLPVRLVARFDYATAEYVKSVKCPVLVVHSKDDEIVPYALGRRVFDAAPEPREFLEVRGGHNGGFLFSGEIYTEGLDDFLTKHPGARRKGPSPAKAPGE